MAKYSIGIDFGCTGIKAGIVDENYTILCKDKIPIREDHDFDNTIKEMADLIQRLIEKNGNSISDFSQIGIGAPGFVDPNNGNIVFVNNMGWWDAPVASRLQSIFGLPVFTENDANCAAIGEMLAGAGVGRKNILLLTLGTGVGGGLILNGKLFPGCDHMGAEFGHVPLIAGGIPCSCGKNGCLESYASVTALIMQTKEAMENDPQSMLCSYTAKRNGIVDGRTAFDCARAGDKTALRVVDTFIDYVSQGIGGFINVFRPELILIGGGLSNEGSYLIDPLNEKVKQYVFSYQVVGAPPIAAAKLGNDAGIVGAAFANLYAD